MSVQASQRGTLVNKPPINIAVRNKFHDNRETRGNIFAPSTVLNLSVKITSRTRTVFKNQFVTIVLPHPEKVIQIYLNFVNIVGSTKTIERPQKRLEITDEHVTADEAKTPQPAKMVELDISKGKERFKERLREIILKNETMWDGTIGEI